jgi:hypothetical protein
VGGEQKRIASLAGTSLDHAIAEFLQPTLHGGTREAGLFVELLVGCFAQDLKRGDDLPLFDFGSRGQRIAAGFVAVLAQRDD